MENLRIGINGFGRIGRAITRIVLKDRRSQIVTVNDIDPNVKNHAYLFEYDTTYGQYDGQVGVDGEVVTIDGQSTRFYAEDKIDDVPWESHEVDVVVDASGVQQNVIRARNLVEEDHVSKIVVTHEPAEGLDKTIIFGVNEEEYKSVEHDVVGASICDANALAPAINLLDQNFGVQLGFVTTLHPWLGYQNLLDSSVRSVSSPGHYWDDFQLGRASDKNLIPKDTTAIKAINAVMPSIQQKMKAMSFRIPTAIVSCSDVNVRLDTQATTNQIKQLFKKCARRSPRIFGYNEEPLVSSDFKGIEQSLVFDARWAHIQQKRNLHIILWYDNEWGYSQRVVDTVKHILSE